MPPEPKPRVYVGIDPSFTALGIAAVSVYQINRVEHCSDVISTDIEDYPDQPAKRMLFIFDKIVEFLRDRTLLTQPPTRCAIEGISFGSRHSLAYAGQIDATARLAIKYRTNLECEAFAPVSVKQYVAPHWRGWSKAKWAAAGSKGAFQKSMPPKEEVIACLNRYFGIRCGNDAEADATAIALLCAHRDGALPAVDNLTCRPGAQSPRDDHQAEEAPRQETQAQGRRSRFPARV